MPLVDILLATYNGAKYLPEQLASLEAQTHTDWRLIVRDDGSGDGSLGLVRDWAAETGRDLIVLEDSDTRLGPAQSFGRLLARSDAPYFAFCDQDDVWRENKIERLLEEIRSMEADFGANAPLLVHCDLAIVDATLDFTGDYFWEQAHISTASIANIAADRRARSGLLVQNVVTGCAALGNSRLRGLAVPQPDGVHVHDWWVALIGAYVGAVRGVPEPLVKYRQHGSNSIGAKSWDPLSMLKRFMADPAGSVQKTRLVLAKLQRQAQCFHDAFADRLEESDRKAILEFATLRQQGLLKRKTFMIRHGVYPQAWLRRLVLFCLI